MTPTHQHGDGRACGEEGCLVDRLEAQFDKGIKALSDNQSANMQLIRETIEAQINMVTQTVRDMRDDNTRAHDEMFTRLRSLEVSTSAYVTDAQVRLLLKTALEENEEIKSVARWKGSCRKVQIAIVVALAFPTGIAIYKLIGLLGLVK